MAGKSNFKTPNQKELQQLIQRKELLHRSAIFLNQNFVGKKMHYKTVNNEIVIHFSKSNFMHLCGVKYTKGAGKFFDDCLHNQLEINSLKVKNDGTTIQKLQVLSSISELIGANVRLTEAGTFLYLKFDYSLRTNRQILALTLKSTENKTIPQSILNLKSQKKFPVGEIVTEIYSIDNITKQVKRLYISNEK